MLRPRWAETQDQKEPNRPHLGGFPGRGTAGAEAQKRKELTEIQEEQSGLWGGRQGVTHGRAPARPPTPAAP